MERKRLETAAASIALFVANDNPGNVFHAHDVEQTGDEMVHLAKFNYLAGGGDGSKTVEQLACGAKLDAQQSRAIDDCRLMNGGVSSCAMA